MQSARQDIKAVESWGYSRSEALEFVTRRAIAHARQVADESRVAPDRELLERQLAYLAELRSICMRSLGKRRFSHA